MNQNYCIHVHVHVAPNFRGTIFSWILWFDFWSRKFSSQKFSIIVGVATFQAHCKHNRAYTCTHTSEHINCLKWIIEFTANYVQTLCAYFQKMSKSCLPNSQEVGGPLSKQLPSSCIKSANNHVEKMTKQMIAEGAKGIGKARLSFV